MSGALDLPGVLEALTPVYGPVPAPFPVDPFELVLWENVAYLADDTKRRQAFETLRSTVGTRPDQMIEATPEQLLRVTGHGILPDDFVERLRSVAEIALGEFDGDLHAVLSRPVAEAKRALRRFPGIGEPGAEKILLFSGTHPFLASESNGLRVLVRLGLCPEGKNYAATYGAARELADRQLGRDFDRLLAARHYLRMHGKITCRRTGPACTACVLRPSCPFP